MRWMRNTAVVMLTAIVLSVAALSAQENMRRSYSGEIHLDLLRHGPTVYGYDIWMTRDEGRSWVLVGKTYSDEKRYSYKAKDEGVYGFHVHPRTEARDDGYVPSGGNIPKTVVKVVFPQDTNIPLLYSNRHQLSISYVVSDLSTNGRFRSWLYYTQDSGLSWHLYGEDEDGVSPVDFQAATDGLYGFKVVSMDPVNQIEKSPEPGTPPDVLVRIDSKPPDVWVITPQPNDLWESNTMRVIRWEATDEAIDEKDCVTLYYAIGAPDNFRLIQSRLPAAGSYVWTIPESPNGRIYLKAEAVDKSENVGTSSYMEPFFTKNVLPETLDPAVRSQADEYCMTATICRKNKDFNKAVKYFRLCLQLNPYHVVAHNDLGVTLSQMGLHKDALAHYELGLKYSPSHEALLLNLAKLYIDSHQYRVARKVLTRLIVLNPRSVEGLYFAAIEAVESGDIERARAFWTRIANLDIDKNTAIIRWVNEAKKNLARSKTVTDSFANAKQLR